MVLKNFSEASVPTYQLVKKSHDRQQNRITLNKNSQVTISGQMEKWFANLDFPEIAGDFPFLFATFWVFCSCEVATILSSQLGCSAPHVNPPKVFHLPKAVSPSPPSTKRWVVDLPTFQLRLKTRLPQFLCAFFGFGQWDFQGPPAMGPSYGKRDPYYSHTIPM